MNNNLLQIKIKERLNKLASLDYDNIECWQIAEAFNKAQLEWTRNQVHGNNQRKEGDESTKMLIDDLQVLLTPATLTTASKEDGKYFLTSSIPDNYLYYKRLSVKAATECCASRDLVVYLAPAADVDNLLLDALKSPSAEWGETFAVMSNNKFEVYADGKFTVPSATLTYYRKPREVSFTGCINPSTGATSTNVECEFKDDIAELIVDEACSILAGDMELFNQYQRTKQTAQSNN